MVREILKGAVLFLKKEDGPTAVEYAVMLALMIVVCVAAVSTIGSATSTIYVNSVLKSGLNGS